MAESMESNDEFSRQMSSVSHAGLPSQGSEIASGGSRTTTVKLDFYEVMGRLQNMFPLDTEVIEAVLRANDGDVDASVNDLLAMCTDDLADEIRPVQSGVMQKEKEAKDATSSKPHHHHRRHRGARDLPPSYEQAISMSQAAQLQAGDSSSIRAATQEPLAEKEEAMIDFSTYPPQIIESPPDQKTALNQVDAAFHSLQLAAASSGQSPSRTTSCRSQPPSSHASGSCLAAQGAYRIWNPPLLGTLPEDFLRLTQTPHHRRGIRTNPSSAVEGQSTPPHVCRNCGRQHHHQRQKTRVVEPPAGEAVTSQGQQPPTDRANQQQHSHHSPHRSSMDRRVGELLQKRLEQNAEKHRRASLSGEMDAEMAQYLDDERMAILLQNQEFLGMLRHDPDFLRSLQRDRLNGSQPAPNPTVARQPTEVEQRLQPAPDTSTRPDKYDQEEVASEEPNEAFPFTRQLPIDDNELRSELTHMGIFSKKRFAALAKRFFSVRYKKRPPPIPFYKGDMPSESTMNLLEDDETELETRQLRDDEDKDRRALDDIVEFEPWPNLSPPQVRSTFQAGTTSVQNSSRDVI